MTVACACSGAINDGADSGFEQVLVQNAVNHDARQQIVGHYRGKLPSLLQARNIKTFCFEESIDRIEMRSRHNEDDALSLAAARTREKTDRLVTYTVVFIWIYDVASWMRV